MESTCDPDVFIEERRTGYIRYLRISDTLRWEVSGVCDYRGNCIIGSVIDTPHGPVVIRDHAHIEELKKELGVERLGSQMDTPVAPGFKGCCPLRIEVL
jgi:hypothetical protein